MELRSYFVKLIKKLAVEGNMIAIIRKDGDFFYHVGVASELCDVLKVKHEDVINKSLFEIHPIDEANERRKHYLRAWEGEEVLYKTDNSLQAEHGSYVVLSPVMYKSKVVGLTLHVVPNYMIPEQLTGIA